MKEINVKGAVFTLDDEDYDLVSNYCWVLNNRGYANAAVCDGHRGGEVISMHELVLGKAGEGMEIHHKDGNIKNNCKANLEYVTRQTNQMLKGKQKNNSSGYRGVCYDRSKRKWLASITVNGKALFLGRYKQADEAAKVWDAKAKTLYGEKTYLNFP